jgi:hypothetical protein
LPTRGDRLVLLLPERRRFAGQTLVPAFAAAVGRGERLTDGAEGETAQLQRHFDVQAAGWPLAANTRAVEGGDAGSHAWLRADPAFLRAEMAGARLMACGEGLVTTEDTAEFLAVLQPVFAESGWVLSECGSGRWYLQLPRETTLPDFVSPADALGRDILAFVPAGPEGRRWRTLANEAQVLLHNHPRNVARAQAGLPPVNSLWFWGGGVLPDAVRSVFSSVETADPDLAALAAFAEAGDAKGEAVALLDLRAERDFAAVQARVLAQARRVPLLLDCADGARFALSPGQRWRVWRRAVDVRA